MAVRLRDSTELQQDARDVHIQARRTYVEQEDSLLTFQNGTRFSGIETLSEQETTGFIKGSIPAGLKTPFVNIGSIQAHHTFGVQKASSSTAFQTKKDRDSSTALPSGIPVIDHMSAAAASRPDWSSIGPHIDYLGQRRIPLEADRQNVWELTIGRSTPEDIISVHAWMRKQMKDQEESGIFCLPATDCESLSIYLEPHQTDGSHSGLAALLKHLSENRNGHCLKIAQERQPGMALPVLFMAGGDGWSLFIRLPVAIRDRKIWIAEGVYYPEFDDLFEDIGVAVGVGVVKDYQEWCDTVCTLWPSSRIRDRLLRPIELEWIFRLAGNSSRQSSIKMQLWTMFGTMYPKHYKTSMGDNKWGLPFDQLHSGLQQYLMGDTQMVSRLACGWIIAWVMQIFPHASLIYEINGMTPSDLVRWFHDYVIIPLLPDISEDCSYPLVSPQSSLPSTREELLQQIRVPCGDRYAILRVDHSFPSLTSGWVRCLHSARAKMMDIMPILRLLDPVSFPAMQDNQIQLHLFCRNPAVVGIHPPHPVSSAALHPHPSVKLHLHCSAEEFTMAHLSFVREEKLTKRSAVHEAACLYPIMGHDLLLRLEAEGAKRLARRIFGGDLRHDGIGSLQKICQAHGFASDSSGESQVQQKVREMLDSKLTKLMVHTANLLRIKEKAHEVDRDAVRSL